VTGFISAIKAINKVMIDGDNLIINNENYKGTEGLWKF